MGGGPKAEADLNPRPTPGLIPPVARQFRTTLHCFLNYNSLLDLDVEGTCGHVLTVG